MSKLKAIDQRFITFARNNYSWIARVSLFIIYSYFGMLKIIGASPADELAIGFAQHMGMGAYSYELYIILAIIECVIGVLILFPKLTRIAIFIMFGHMLIVCSPLIAYPQAVWEAILVPNLEGQYIIKNAALVALALGLVARTKPLTKK